MKLSKSRKAFPTVCMVLQALIPIKHMRQIISSMVVVLLLGPNAQAQTGDWRAVQNLQPGSRIMVRTQHRYPCIFVSATEDELFCDVPQHRLTGLPPRMTFFRQEVREVRREPNQAKDAWIGAGIGAGAGAVVGGTNNRDYPGFHAVVGAAGGAGAGALVGAIIPIFQVIFHGGKLIYRQ